MENRRQQQIDCAPAFAEASIFAKATTDKSAGKQGKPVFLRLALRTGNNRASRKDFACFLAVFGYNMYRTNGMFIVKDSNKKKFSHRAHRDLSAVALAKAEMNYKQCKSVLIRV